MKKLMLLIAAAVFIYQTSQAQTEKGTQTLGANLGFSYTKTNQNIINPYDQSSTIDNSKSTSFTFGPTYSYFIANKLDLGASLEYQSNITNSNPNTYDELTKQVNRYYGASIFLRKYFMYTDKLGLRAGPYINYEKVTTKYNYTAANAESNLNANQDIIDGGLGLDLVYYPSKHLGVSATIANLSYEHTKINNGDQGNGSSNDVNFDFINNNLTFSIFYAFGGK
jgi:hypothetical protein